LKADIEDVSNPQIKIAPLVLIVFVENAFKHAKDALTKEIEIGISLKITGNSICFATVNSYRVDKSGEVMADDESGLGLQNTIKRLGLVYGDDYRLKQYTEEDRYHVELLLKIKE
ncbi:MAG TPA: hypothetical protein VHC47_08255, partial [Mucilaginibacter sp.]|nr:hypothetical protein [Mucilaginibacter sp.]